MTATAGDFDRELVQVLDEMFKRLDPVAQDHLKNLIAATAGDPDQLLGLLKQLALADYKWNPVDTETFILSPDYLGLDGTRGRIFPRLLEDAIELFEDPIGYEQAVIMGGIGFGKSTIAEVALSRMVYEASCLINPQKVYGLMDGSTIAFINASVNLKQAEKVVFSGLKQKLSTSPYFKEQFPFDAALKKEMRFPGNLLIMPVAGSEGGTVGYNVLGGVLDEVNFWQQTEKSLQNRGAKFDQARHVYDLLSRRIKSRFNKAGKLPGILLQVSSSKYPDDFTEERAQEVEQALREHHADPVRNAHPKTLVRRYSTWATKDRKQFLPEDFYLYRGSTADNPGIALDPAAFADKDPALVIPVPMDFYPEFKADLPGSLRDSAGFPTLSIEPFFTQKDKLVGAIERGRLAGFIHPYTVDETTLEDGAWFDNKRITFDPTKWYYAHVDLAIKKDRAGIAVAHISGWRDIQRPTKGGTGQMVTEREPIITVDFMLRVQAPEGGEIQVDYVRALLLELRSYGCNLRKVTYDQYQSASSIQAFQRMGIESEKYSVDTTMDAYEGLKEAIVEERLVLYDYEPFVEEMVRLERKQTSRGMKVDHPPKGSKDVTDAVAGAVYHCIMAKAFAQMDPSHGEVLEAAIAPAYRTKDGRALTPTVDAAGNLLPGKKLRTIEDVMWGDLTEPETDDDFIGFA